MKFFLSFLLACILSLTAVFAQTSKGFVVGTVADPNGAVVPGATVELSLKLRSRGFFQPVI